MASPVRYSVQPSTMIPAGFTGQYGRLQVDQREQTNTVIISATDYDVIVAALKEGKLIGMKDATGRDIGQLQLGLAGGFNVSTFNSATTADARISFKPTQELLALVRDGMTFQQVAPVVIMPVITSITFKYNVGSGAGQTVVVLNNKIKMGTVGILRLNGIHFVIDQMLTEIVKPQGTASISLVNLIASGTKFSEYLIGESDFIAPWTIGSAKVTTGVLNKPEKTSPEFNVVMIDN